MFKSKFDQIYKQIISESKLFLEDNKSIRYNDLNLLSNEIYNILKDQKNSDKNYKKFENVVKEKFSDLAEFLSKSKLKNGNWRPAGDQDSWTESLTDWFNDYQTNNGSDNIIHLINFINDNCHPDVNIELSTNNDSDENKNDENDNKEHKSKKEKEEDDTGVGFITDAL